MIGRLVMTRRAVRGVLATPDRRARRIPTISTAPVPNLATIFTDLFGPRGLIVDSLATLPGRAAALGALQQRLPVQLQPVQHRAGQPARERAAAVAGRRLHLPVRRHRSASSSARRRASARFSPIAPTRSARGECRSASPPSASRSTASKALDLQPVPAVFTHDNAQLLGGRQDVVTTTNSHRGRRQPGDDVRDAGRHRSLRHLAGGADGRRPISKVVSDATHPAARHDQPA